MTENKSSSEVQTRLRAALALHKNERPGEPLNISDLCRQAGINRSNLYANHPMLLKEIRDLSRKNNAEKRRLKEPTTHDSTQLKRLRMQNKALLYICLELRCEVDDLEAKCARASSALNFRTRK